MLLWKKTLVDEVERRRLLCVAGTAGENATWTSGDTPGLPQNRDPHDNQRIWGTFHPWSYYIYNMLFLQPKTIKTIVQPQIWE